MANKIQFKRGIKATLPALSVGEPALCTDTGEVFIGGTSGNIGIAKASDLTDKANKTEVAPSGFGLGTTGKNISSTDANNAKACGWYLGENITNAPTTGAGQWYNIEVVGNNGEYITQVATSWFTNTRYARVCSGGVWQPWYRILDQRDYDVLNNSKFDKTGGTFTGVTKAQNNTSYTVAQLHNVILSTTDAVLGSMQNGDIWIKYV